MPGGKNAPRVREKVRVIIVHIPCRLSRLQTPGPYLPEAESRTAHSNHPAKARSRAPPPTLILWLAPPLVCADADALVDVPDDEELMVPDDEPEGAAMALRLVVEDGGDAAPEEPEPETMALVDDEVDELKVVASPRRTPVPG